MIPTAEFAERFHRLHEGPKTFVLTNAWDPMSARLLASLGFPAIATTSSGVSWAHAKQDGENLTVDEVTTALSRICAAADIPVSADVEKGFGSSPEAVANTISAVIRAGAVGVNLEDGSGRPDDPLIPASAHSERLRAARTAAKEAGLRLFINGRTDVYLRSVGEPSTRFERTVERALAYIEAGADGIFVPGVTDLATIARLVEAIPAPLNVLLSGGTAPVAELEEVGVKRLSTGGRFAEAVLGLLTRAATELRDKGTYETLTEYALPYPELQALFRTRRP